MVWVMGYLLRKKKKHTKREKTKQNIIKTLLIIMGSLQSSN